MNETANVREVLDICRDHVALWNMSVAMVVITVKLFQVSSRESLNPESLRWRGHVTISTKTPLLVGLSKFLYGFLSLEGYVLHIIYSLQALEHTLLETPSSRHPSLPSFGRYPAFSNILGNSPSRYTLKTLAR